MFGRTSIILSTFLMLSIGLFAQKSPIGAELSYARGVLLPHRAIMQHLPQGPAQAIELRIFQQTNGSKAWHNTYNLPQLGIAIKGFDLANRGLLGYGLGIAAYFSSPVLSTPRFKWNLEIGAGPGIVSKPFSNENYKNIAIGSYGNAFVFLGQRFSYEVKDRMHLSLAMAFNHFSNSAYSLPNLGLNYPTVSLGVGYVFQKSTTIDSIPKSELRQKGRWIAAFGAGLKEVADPKNVKFPTFSLMTERTFGLSKKSSASAGIDVMYNSALYASRNADSNTVTALQNLQLGLKIGYNLHIDQAQIFLQAGWYAIDSNKKDGNFYHRAGIRYFFTDHFGTHLALRTHLFKADYFEAGMAYRF
jgi:hypothetical protein